MKKRNVKMILEYLGFKKHTDVTRGFKGYILRIEDQTRKNTRTKLEIHVNLKRCLQVQLHCNGECCYTKSKTIKDIKKLYFLLTGKELKKEDKNVTPKRLECLGFSIIDNCMWRSGTIENNVYCKNISNTEKMIAVCFYNGRNDVNIMKNLSEEKDKFEILQLVKSYGSIVKVKEIKKIIKDNTP